MTWPNDIYTEPAGDPDTLANLGPLRPMAGVWQNDAGVDVLAAAAIRDVMSPRLTVRP